ncbi:class I SAM-dependent methyltransferase [Acidobacteriota bacterium]
MPTDPVKTFFDGKAPEREAEFASSPVLMYEQKRRRKALAYLTEPDPGSRILDVGCGNLLDYPIFKGAGCCYIGVDFSVEMLRDGVGRYPECKGRVVIADARQLPFRMESFDRVVASEIVEHVPEYEKIFNEIAPILKPGGTLTVSCPNRRSLYGLARWFWERKHEWEHPYDKWKTPIEIKAQCRRAGLKVRASRGACYLPALFGIAIPRKIQHLMVAVISPFEPLFARVLPGFAYILGVRADKRGR